METYDLVIIGSGPAGYVGAIRASQLGMKVACVEKRDTLGGTCLNVGCIPSKALLNISEEFEHLKKASLKSEGFPIQVEKVSIDITTMLFRKNKIVEDLTKGIDSLFAKNKIKRFLGHASFASKEEAESQDVVIKIEKDANTSFIAGKKVLIATGSSSFDIEGVVVDEKDIVSSTGALDFKEAPSHLVVVGGGYIGLELGSVWRRLGSKVTVVEYADTIVPVMDFEVRKEFLKILQKQGIEFYLSTKLEKIEKTEGGLKVLAHSIKDEKKLEIDCTKVLVSVGRKPNTEGLNLDVVGVLKDERGRIKVDKHFQTNVPNIFAVGDVIEGPMLAHKAEEEAVCAVELMNNVKGHVNYEVIPGVVYTNPEVASVGLTEDEAKKRGLEYKVGKFPFLANSRARTVMATEGFVKIITDAKTDRIIGAHIIGKDAGNLISELVLGMEYKASSEDIARTVHAHPTLSEAVKEACLSVDKRTINL